MNLKLTLMIIIVWHVKQLCYSLLNLLENLQQHNDMAFIDRSVINPQTTAMMQMGISQAREFDDPAGLQEKADMLLHEWVTMYHSPQAGRDSSKAFQSFVAQVGLYILNS